MADGIEGALTRKLGPLPVWAYLGVGGGALILFLLYRRGASAGATSGTQAAGAPGTSPYAPSPIVITPQTMPVPNPPTSGTSSSSGITAGSSNPALQGPPFNGLYIPLYRDAATWNQANGQIGLIPVGTALTSTGSASSGPGGNSFIPVSYQGLSGVVSSTDITGGSGGMGGGSALSLFGDGRHANPGAVLGPHLLTQHVSIAGMGGGGAGRNSRGVTGRTGGTHSGPLSVISSRTGTPMLRLLSLNPGTWRPGSGQSGRYARVQ